MNATLSLFAGVGAQFFDNNGIPLSGGKIYTYQAGTTTPASTYTTATASVAHTNPIVLDSAGRIPSGGEIWLQIGAGYKFVVKTSAEVLIATYDNVPTSAVVPVVNDASSVAYEPGYVVTAGSFVIGQTYQIQNLGNTDFTLVGAATNTIGTFFTATGVGSGTGTAFLSTTVQAKLRQYVSVKDFGAVGDGVTDDLAAFEAAIASFPTNQNVGNVSVGGVIFVPFGVYYLSDTLVIDRGVKIIGESPVFSLDPGASQLLFADNIDGIHLPRWNPGVTTGASMATLENLSLRRANTGGTLGNGILAETHFQLSNCKIEGFRECGIKVVTTLTTKNANQSLIYNTTSGFNGSHGFFITGDNGNAGCFTALNTIGNSGWGVYDDSFLGNTYVACHNDANTLGSYKTTNANAACVFIGCYEEPGQPQAEFESRTLVIGGTFAQGFAAGNKGGFIRQGLSAVGNPVTVIDSTEIQSKLTTLDSIGVGQPTTRNYQSDTKGVDVGAYTSLMNAQGFQVSLANNAYYNSGYKYTNGSYSAAAYVQASGAHQFLVDSSTGSAGTAISFATGYQISNTGQPYFPLVGTTASGANAVLNNASSPANELLRSTSSIRYKTNVEDIQPDKIASIVAKLRPVWYRSKAQADRKDWSWYGLIAEEVAEIEPRLVNWTYLPEDYELVETQDSTGRTTTEQKLKPSAQLKPDGVQYERLTVLLLAEIQRLQAKIDR